jgi:Zn-dependent protease
LLLTYLDLLSDSLLLFAAFFGSAVVSMIAGITFHEFSHAFVADRLGDRTARMLGRVSLSPRRHLDPAGTLFLMLAGFGWGKPVPVNPSRLRNGPQAGRAMVAAAGPIANIILAALAALPLQLGLVEWWNPLTRPFDINAWGFDEYASLFLGAAIFFNIVLAVFNLLPFSPLDGFSVAVGLLPRDLSITVARLEQYGPLILMLLLLMPLVSSGQISLLHSIMSPIINGISQVIAGHDIL